MPATRSCEAQTYQRWLSWTPLGAPVVPEVNISAALPSAVARLSAARAAAPQQRLELGRPRLGRASSTVTSSRRSAPPTASSRAVPRAPATASRGSATSERALVKALARVRHQRHHRRARIRGARTTRSGTRASCPARASPGPRARSRAAGARRRSGGRPRPLRHRQRAALVEGSRTRCPGSAPRRAMNAWSEARVLRALAHAGPPVQPQSVRPIGIIAEHELDRHARRTAPARPARGPGPPPRSAPRSRCRLRSAARIRSRRAHRGCPVNGRRTIVKLSSSPVRTGNGVQLGGDEAALAEAAWRQQGRARTPGSGRRSTRRAAARPRTPRPLLPSA